MQGRIGSWLVAAVVIALVGCADGERAFGPESMPAETSPIANELARFDCTVEVRGGTIACSPSAPRTPAGLSAAVIGGQGQNVLLESDNVDYDGTEAVFSADVTVLNLLALVLGTEDGESAHADGVRVFFYAEPTVTGGTGTVTVANPTGTAMFTESGQPYFQYDAPLGAMNRSESRTWEWNVPNTVESFTFSVAVSAEIAEEAIGGRFDAVGLAGGTWHSCALTGEGEAYCWGDEWGLTPGVIGHGALMGSLTPVAVSGGHTFVTIDANQFHNCALTTSGEAYCWGMGQSGRLGNGDANDRYVPTAVVGGHRFVAIAAGLSHSCGLTAAGTAYCWGRNEESQLGVSGILGSSVPVEVELPGQRLVAITAGENHTCALNSSGEAYCWGVGASGQLGDGFGDVYEDPPHISLPVAVEGGHTFVAISAGGNVSCGLTAAGSAYCWGDGRAGQLGDGQGVISNVPVKVANVDDFVSISNGQRHSCGLTRSGTAYCWGSPQSGRLGDGDTEGAENALEPVPVDFGGSFIAVRAFEDHACGIAADGGAYCWGNGSFGRLGTGGTSNQFAPAPVAGFTY